MEFYVMGLILKVLVWSQNYKHLELLSLSVAEISAEEETLVAPFLLSSTRRSLLKNDRILDALPTDISATEKLSMYNKILLSQILHWYLWNEPHNVKFIQDDK